MKAHSPQVSLAMDLPKVTIAIPTLNRVDYLRLALESALRQTYGNLEVILSNNASKDDTANYLASIVDPRLRVIEQATTLPMTENWNACLAAATGEYLLLLSDDDLLAPNAIAELVAGYAEQDGYPSPGIVYCGGWVLDAVGEVTRPFRDSPAREAARDLIPAFLEGKRDLRFCAVLLRTEDVRPGFPTTYRVACDAAVWMRAVMRRGDALFIARQLVGYRQHQNLSSATHLDVWRAETRQLCQLVISEDRQSAHSDPAFANRMGAVLQRVERNLIAGRINQLYPNNRRKALLEYARRLDAFLSLQGILFLARRVAALLLGENGKLWLQQMMKK